ncbi:MAG: nuclear transport factor 2 family protein [Mycobacterium sp.]|jgi:hypothetical protein|nr:nuclear transport factor 2 family protein [Mycobacterium sp.]
MSERASGESLAYEALLDERSIHRALSYFARAADSRAYGLMRNVFADDVVFDYGSGREERGLAALLNLVTLHLDRCGPTQHLIGSTIIDVDGERAVSKAYVQARHQRRDDPHGSVFDTNGEYTDQWTRRSDGWRIVDRRARWAITTGDPSILHVPE